MDDLIAFLTARLDEDCDRASTAIRDNKRSERGMYGRGGSEWAAPIRFAWKELGYDPHRQHREVVAKRAILAEHQPDAHYVRDGNYRACSTCGDVVTVKWPCPTVRHMAAVYAGHPDYRAEWKP